MQTTEEFKKKSRRFNEKRRAALAIETYNDIIQKIIMLEAKTKELINNEVKPVLEH